MTEDESFDKFAEILERRMMAEKTYPGQSVVALGSIALMVGSMNSELIKIRKLLEKNQ